MSSGISEEEFAAYQLQLLQLREQKYASDEIRIKAIEKINLLEKQLYERDVQLQRLNTIINKSKVNREFDLLLKDNEILRDRLAGVESNFILQIDTLRQECSHLMTENASLKEDLDRFQSVARELVSATTATTTTTTSNPNEPTVEDTVEESRNNLEKSSCESCHQFSLQIITYLTEIDNLKKELQLKDNEILDYSTNLVEKTKEIKKLQNNFHIQTEQHEHLSSELIDKYKKEIDKLSEISKMEFSKLTMNYQEEKSVLQECIASRDATLTQLTQQLQTKTNFFQTEMSKLNTRIEEERNEFALRLDSFQESKEKEMKILSEKYQLKMKQLESELINLKEDNQKQLLEINQLTQQCVELKEENEKKMQEKEQGWTSECQSVRELFTAQLDEKQIEIDRIKLNQQEVLSKLQLDLEKSQQQQKQLRGELRSQKRKYERQLKDVQRDLDKELKRGDDLQCQLAEHATTRSRQSIDDYLQNCRNLNSTHFDHQQQQQISGAAGVSTTTTAAGGGSFGVVQDDTSSIASFNTGSMLGNESACGSIQSMPVYESDLTGVIERLVSVQDENCDLKRQLQNLRSDLHKLDEQMQRKDAIIQRYLSSRGAIVDPSMEHLINKSNDCHSLSSSTSSSSSYPGGGGASGRGGSNTNVTNTTNSAFSSSSSTSSSSSSSVSILNQSVNKVLDHLKTKRLESFEFKQMKNICEELMTRNLHLEENLKSIVDRNHELEEDLALLRHLRHDGSATPT